MPVIDGGGNASKITLTASLDDKLSPGLKSLQAELTRLYRAIRSLKAPTEAISQAQDRQRIAMDAVRSAAERERTSLQAKIAILKGNTAEAQRLTRALREQQKASLAAATGDERLAQELSDLQEEYDRLQRAEQQQNEALQRQQELSEKSAAAAQQLATTVGVAFSAIGAAAVGAFGLAIRSAADFDEAMRNVSTLIDTNVIDLGELSQAVLDLPPAFGSATEMAMGLYKAISAGITDPKEALEVLSQAAMFAKANLADMGSSIDFLTTVLNAYALDASDATHVTDVFTRAITLGKTTGQELAQSMGMVIPVAANLKVPIEELAAALVVMTLQGIQTDHAVVSLNQVLTTFLSPTSQAKKLAKELGIELSATAIRTKGMRQAIADLAMRIDRMNEGPLKDEAMSIFFGNVRALRGILALTGEQAERFNRILGDLRNSAGQTARDFGKQEEATNKVFHALLSNIGRLQIEIGSQFLPAINSLLKGINFTIDRFRGMDDETKALIGTIELVGGSLLIFSGTFLLLAPRIVATTTAVRDLTVWLSGGRLLGALRAITGVAISPWFLAASSAVGVLSAAYKEIVDQQERVNRRMIDAIHVTGDHEESLRRLQEAAQTVRETNADLADAFEMQARRIKEMTQNIREAVAETIAEKLGNEELAETLLKQDPLLKGMIKNWQDQNLTLEEVRKRTKQYLEVSNQQARSLDEVALRVLIAKSGNVDLSLSVLRLRNELADLQSQQKESMEAQGSLTDEQKAFSKELEREKVALEEEIRRLKSRLGIQDEMTEAEKKANQEIKKLRLEYQLKTATLEEDQKAMNEARAALDELSMSELSAKFVSQELAKAYMEEKSRLDELEERIENVRKAEELLNRINEKQPSLHKGVTREILDDYREFAEEIKKLEDSLGEKHELVLELKEANEAQFIARSSAAMKEHYQNITSIMENAAQKQIAIDEDVITSILTRARLSLEEREKILSDYIEIVSKAADSEVIINEEATRMILEDQSKSWEERIRMLRAYVEENIDQAQAIEAIEKSLQSRRVELAEDEFDRRLMELNQWYVETEQTIRRTVRDEEEAARLIEQITRHKFDEANKIQQDWEKKHGGIINQAKAAWEDFTSNIVDSSKSTFDTFQTILQDTGKFFKEAFVAIITLDLNRLKRAFSDFAQSVLNAFSELIARVIAQWIFMRTKLNKIIPELLDWIVDVFRRTKQETEDVVSTLQNAFVEATKVLDGFNERIVLTGTLLASLGILNFSFDSLLGGLSSISDGIDQIIGGTRELEKTDLSGLGNTLRGIGSAASSAARAVSILAEGTGFEKLGIILKVGGLVTGVLGAGLALFGGGLFGGRKRPPRRGFRFGTRFEGLQLDEAGEFIIGQIDTFVTGLKRVSMDAGIRLANAMEQIIRNNATILRDIFNRFPEDIRRSIEPLILEANKKIRRALRDIIIVSRDDLQPLIDQLLSDIGLRTFRPFRGALQEAMKLLFEATFPEDFAKGLSEVTDAFIEKFSMVGPKKRPIFLETIGSILDAIETFDLNRALFNAKEIDAIFGALREIIGGTEDLRRKDIEDIKAVFDEFSASLMAAVSFLKEQQDIIDADKLSEFNFALKKLREEFEKQEQQAESLLLTNEKLHQAQAIRLRNLIDIANIEEELAQRTTPELTMALQELEAWWIDMEERTKAISEGIIEGLLAPEEMDRFLDTIERLREVRIGDLVDKFVRPLRDLRDEIQAEIDTLMGQGPSFMEQMRGLIIEIGGETSIEDSIDVAQRAMDRAHEWLTSLADFASFASQAGEEIVRLSPELRRTLPELRDLFVRLSEQASEATLELRGAILERMSETLKEAEATVQEIISRREEIETQLSALRDNVLPAYREFFSTLDADLDQLLGRPIDWMARFEADLAAIDTVSIEDALDAASAAVEDIKAWFGQMSEFASIADLAARKILDFQLSTLEGIQERISELTGMAVTDASTAIDALRSLLDAARKAPLEERADLLAKIEESIRLAERLAKEDSINQEQLNKDLISVWRELEDLARAAEEESRQIAVSKMEDIRSAIMAQQIALEEKMDSLGDQIDELTTEENNNVQFLLDGWREIQQLAQEADKAGRAQMISWLEEIRNAIDSERTEVAGSIAALEANLITALHELRTGVPAVPAAHGIDFVPRDQFSVIAHRGEAVITARGNEALARILSRLESISASRDQMTIVIEPAPVVLDGRQIAEVTFKEIGRQGEIGRRIVPSTAIYQRK